MCIESSFSHLRDFFLKTFSDFHKKILFAEME
ncbi:hypothetical protein CP_0734 [Chlamydia pneumoniae AR39]|uniref:Uncharacterized protein n=1 Tax=Chlamydia pneumoniae TaxID=83558 RepID=Q9K200_CHLPN|nr:hypothetical protein CP_0734 [Chlamydia pneumoniae AR39]